MTKAAMTLGTALAITAAVVAADEADAYEVWSSYYGEEFAGQTMANGEAFVPWYYTCAHRTYPFGTVLYLESDGYYSWCVVTDRGPYIYGRDLDVSLGVAYDLGLIYEGVDVVDIYAEDYSGAY